MRKLLRVLLFSLIVSFLWAAVPNRAAADYTLYCGNQPVTISKLIPCTGSCTWFPDTTCYNTNCMCVYGPQASADFCTCYNVYQPYCDSIWDCLYLLGDVACCDYTGGSGGGS